MKKDKVSFLSLILIPVSFLIILIVKNNKWVSEYIFARGIYKFLSQLISNITSLIPFSIMELSIYLIILLSLGYLIYIIRILSVTKENRKKKAISIIANLSSIFSISIFLFVIFAGNNYYRYTFAEINNITVEEASIDELYNLNMYLTRQAYETRELLELNGQYIHQEGVFQFSNINWQELTNALDKAYENLSVDYPILKGNYGRPKSVLYSKFMSRMEITGIFWPFTLEANINIHAPDYTIPFTMAHEMAHVRGFMREDEANYIAFLACSYSDELYLKYSGTMLALASAGNALYKEDPLLYAETRSHYNGGMIADLRDKSNYWSQFDDTVISTVSNKANDTYLKANNQKDGVKSYGRMVDLLLAGYKNNHYY